MALFLDKFYELTTKYKIRYQDILFGEPLTEIPSGFITPENGFKIYETIYPVYTTDENKSVDESLEAHVYIILGENSKEVYLPGCNYSLNISTECKKIIYFVAKPKQEETT